MTTADITVYGAHWCPDCRRSKQFLGEHQIPYNWVDIEADSEGEQFVIEQNNGKRIIPTIVFASRRRSRHQHQTSRQRRRRRQHGRSPDPGIPERHLI
jgi:thioredoxin reductase (NADPH)